MLNTTVCHCSKCQWRCLARLSVRVHRAIAHAYHDSFSSKCLSMLITTLCHRSKCQRRHLSPLSVSVDTYRHSVSATILITTLSSFKMLAATLTTTLCQRPYLSPLSVSVRKCMSMLSTALWQRSKGQCQCLSRHSVSVQRVGVDAYYHSVSVHRVSVNAYHGTLSVVKGSVSMLITTLSAFIGSVSMLITALCQGS